MIVGVLLTRSAKAADAFILLTVTVVEALDSLPPPPQADRTENSEVTAS